MKDALAWLRLLANPDDDAAFLRAVQSPNRGVGATSLQRLGELAAQAHLPLARAAESMAVANLCQQANIPCLSVRIISDTVDDILPPEIEMLLAEKSLVGKLSTAAAGMPASCSIRRRRASASAISKPRISTETRANRCPPASSTSARAYSSSCFPTAAEGRFA